MALIQREGLKPDLLQQVQDVEDFLKDTLEFYRKASTEGRASGEESPAKVRDRMHEIRKLAVSALEEGRRVSEELSRARGIVYDYALDLRAARMEVERLLDRFEAEGRKGALSRQPE